jgi:hypothetical protein
MHPRAIPLREYFRKRYAEKGLIGQSSGDPDHNRRPSRPDLAGKVLLNKGDRVIVDEADYLAAIQSSDVRASVPIGSLHHDGMVADALDRALSGA